MIMDEMGIKKIVDFESGMERELNECRRRCFELQLEIQKKNSEFELLENKFGALVVEKVAIEEELGVLKKKYDDLEKRITCAENGNMEGTRIKVVLTEEKEEEDKVFNLTIENKVLDCEKKKAESEVEVWKAKFKELETRVMVLEGGGEVHQLDVKLKREAELSEMGVKEMHEVEGLKDGLAIATRSANLQVENSVMDSKETINAATGLISDRNGDLQASGTASTAPCKQSTHVEGGNRGTLLGNEVEYGGHFRKQLAFGEGSPSKKMAPSTPGGVRKASIAVIDISDSDGEPESTMPRMPTLENQGNKIVSENKTKKAFLDQSDEEEMGGYKRSSPFIPTPKRKRASNIVTSDSENEDDDNVPICKLKTVILPELSPATVSGDKGQGSASRRRLTSLRNFESTPKRKRASNIVTCDTESEDDDNIPIWKAKTNLLPQLNMDIELNNCIVQESVSRRRLATLRKFDENCRQKISPTSGDLNAIENLYQKNDDEDADMEESGSESEGESLGGFIVNDGSDVSENANNRDGLSRNSNGGNSSGESENASDDEINYREVMSKFRRNGDRKLQWELEGDMLADFGKDPELCMEAVCALYRQQTSEEKCLKGTIYANQRGFSQCDAHRGTTLAEFLTDGDPKGDLVKSVKELEEYDRKGVEQCRTLATHYSKQLFAIYQNKEDPLFHPS